MLVINLIKKEISRMLVTNVQIGLLEFRYRRVIGRLDKAYIFPMSDLVPTKQS